MNSRWKQYFLYASIIIIVGGGLSFILIETVRAKNTGFETKTLWDWMQLLIIPLFLAAGVFKLNSFERESEHQRAEDRAKLEREIATDRQQEAALQAYLDHMSELLLQKELRTSQNNEVHNVARIRTLTILRGLDATRKGIVLLFLHEAGLISKEKPIVDLQSANFEGANLEAASLTHANLYHVNLKGANFKNAYLEGVNFTRANLTFASLVGANLEGANLTLANLTDANLESVNLKGTILYSANLMNTGLEHATLKSANLEGAKVTNEQLATAKSLKGATMPDGTIHE